MTNDGRELLALMTATLSADLEGRVPAERVANIVRTVVAESHQAAQHRGVESGTFVGQGDEYLSPISLVLLTGHLGRDQAHLLIHWHARKNNASMKIVAEEIVAGKLQV